MINIDVVRRERGISTISVMDGFFVEATREPFGYLLLTRKGELVLGNPARYASGRALAVGGNPEPARLLINPRRDFPGGVVVGSDGRIEGDLVVEGSLAVHGDLVVRGAVTVDGTLDAGFVEASEGAVVHERLRVDGELCVEGTVEIHGALVVHGPTDFREKTSHAESIRVDGHLEVGGDARIEGSVSAGEELRSPRLDADDLRVADIPRAEPDDVVEPLVVRRHDQRLLRRSPWAAAVSPETP